MVVDPGTRPVRVDAYLAARGVASRAQVQRMLVEGLATVNGMAVRPSHKLKPGDVIDVQVPAPTPLDIEPAAIPLDIVHEDDVLAVVNKPAGLVVHPAPGHWEGTLVHALLHHLTGLSGVGGRERPGIVHRLDKDTSGLLVVAKTDLAHTRLSAQLKTREMGRRYQAITGGVPKPGAGKVVLAIGRDRRDRKRISRHTDKPREAVTHYRTLQTFSGPFGRAAHVELKLETGRTHQIRVHLTHLGCPVLGDPLYGGKRTKLTGIAVPRLMLHAARLTLIHPESGEKMIFEAALPDDFLKVLADLEKASV